MLQKVSFLESLYGRRGQEWLAKQDLPSGRGEHYSGLKDIPLADKSLYALFSNLVTADSRFCSGQLIPNWTLGHKQNHDKKGFG